MRINRYNQNEILIDLQTNEPGILFLSELYFPAWKAWIDGQETEVLRANHAFRAVAVQPGFHQVRFEYRSESVTRGAAASGVTGLLILAVCLVFYRRGKF